MNIKTLLQLAAITTSSLTLIAQTSTWMPSPGHITVPVWPGQPPNATPNPTAEINTTTDKDPLIAGRTVYRLGNVSTPTITLYAAEDNNTGAAVVVFPGGGYHILAINLEGSEVCNWLNAVGVNCILLKYRVPDSGPYPQYVTALQDVQRAVGLVRQHAVEWKIDPNRVGVIGFSAGGHLVAALSAHFDQRLYKSVDAADQLSCRPDFSVLIYPGYLADNNVTLNANVQPTDKTPPTFLVQAEDDPVHVENSIAYYLALKNAKVPAEMHLFAQGGHGYGLRRGKDIPGTPPTKELPILMWPYLMQTWLQTIGVLPPSSE